MNRLMRHKRPLLWRVGLLACGLWLALALPALAHAQEPDAPTEPTGDNSYCLTCHASSDQTWSLPDGSEYPVQVDLEALARSVHGESGEDGALGCVDCHSDMRYPHDDPLPETARAYTVQSSLVCTSCHTEQTENLADGVHYNALMEGNLRSASCVDCHSAHDVHPPDESLAVQATTCGECHTTSFEHYEGSVHGQALFAGDDNAPTCITCHGVHGIQHPTTALFRNRSPELCADCHADEELMSQYDISTNVFDSYLNDFHGTTVSLFAQTAPNVETNKAVCYDCHGVHDITPADNSKSRVARENLLVTCQECHPGATADFPDSWVGHFPPSAENHPLVWLVDLFYDILIPVVLGGFFVLIGVDIFGRFRRRIFGEQAHEPEGES